MKTKYECNFCGKQFDDKDTCFAHELEHITNDTDKQKYILQAEGLDICKYCKHRYYVYGCRPECEYRDCNSDNNYKDFEGVDT